MITYQLIWKYILFGFIPVVLMWIFLIVKDWKDDENRRKNISFLLFIFTIIFYILLLFFILEVNISSDYNVLEVLVSHKVVEHFQDCASIGIVYLWWTFFTVFLIKVIVSPFWARDKLELFSLKKPISYIIILSSFIVPLIFPVLIYPSWFLILLISLITYIPSFAGIVLMIYLLIFIASIVLIIIGKLNINYLFVWLMPIILSGAYFIYYYSIYGIEKLLLGLSVSRKEKKQHYKRKDILKNKINAYQKNGYDTSELEDVLKKH